MSALARRALPAACSLMMVISLLALADDDKDRDNDAAQQAAQPALNNEQQRAVGIVVAHPLPARAPERIEAIGLVLDETTLIADIGDANASSAAERSASAELNRLHGLYNGGAGASLRMLEAAQAEQARAQAQAEIAAARLAQHWGGQKNLDALRRGHGLLLRADLPGRHTLGGTPARAVLDVDGIEVPGRVIGTLRQTTELQSVGLLIDVPNAPPGLGPGARIPVALLTEQRTGLLLPRDALLYDENGAYVYKQLSKNAAEKARYAPVKVTLLLPFGDGWLVKGVDDDDNIVVHGAGVLWSLQGVGAQPQDDED